MDRKHIKTFESKISELNISDVINSLSDRVDKIAKENDADINKTLFRIVGDHIEVYEIDMSGKKATKSLLGNLKIDDL